MFLVGWLILNYNWHDWYLINLIVLFSFRSPQGARPMECSKTNRIPIYQESIRLVSLSFPPLFLFTHFHNSNVLHLSYVLNICLSSPPHTHTANFKIFLSKSFLLKSILCFVLWESLLPCWTFIADMFFNLHPYSSQWLFLHQVFVSEEYLSVENVPPGLAAKSNLYWSLAKPICSASLDGHFVLNTICG